MKNYQSTLDRILENNLHVDRSTIKNVLIVYEEEIFFIGDTCLRFDKFGQCKSFFGHNAAVHINCIRKQYREFYKCFLEHNSNIDTYADLDYEEIPYEQYDLIISGSCREDVLLEALHKRFSALGNAVKVAVFSFAKLLFYPKFNEDIDFSSYKSIFADYRPLLSRPHELCISAEEKEWGNRYLEANGIKKGEQLFIMVDSSSKRDKVLPLNVYFTVLNYLLSRPAVKLLIFDERNIGKELFYREFLGDRLMERVIVSKGLRLREDLCLMASDYTRLVFGPCTGLLHCASAINNYYVRNGMPLGNAPLMITYTGKWDARAWWGNAPLVHCLLLRQMAHKKEMCVLGDLDDEEKGNYEHRLNCNEYTAEMIIDFVKCRL